MTVLFRSRATLIWLLLVGATVCSVELFDIAGAGIDRRTLGMAVIAIAFVKVRFVGREFMELRHAPLALRLAFDAWVIAIGVTLALLY